MHKYFTIVICLMISGFVSAETKVVSGNMSYQAQDNSPQSQVCMAALESKAVAKRTAIDLGIGRRELNKIRCNGLSVMEFAKANSQSVENWSIATVQ